MSTLMSKDINLTRPSSRVLRAPGGGGSIQLGSDIPEQQGRPSTAPSKTATPASTPAAPAATQAPPAEKKEVQGKIGVIVGGNVEPDALADAIVKALHLEGARNVFISKVEAITALPYGAQSLSKSVDVVIAAAFVDSTMGAGVGSALASSLMQLGLSGRTPIIPALSQHDSLLEAKALLGHEAEGWANSAVTILNLNSGGPIESTQAEAPVIKEKPVLTAETNSVDTLIDVLRHSLKDHGARGIVGIGRKFRIVDDNKNGQIELDEFKKAISEHALGWTPDQIKLVFNFFDTDRSGGISYEEFLVAVRGPMNERRTNLVLQAFQILDSDGSGIIELNDIQKKYDASKHPDVIAGKRSADSVLSEFLDTFDTEEKDGKVTPSEFIKYYNAVSCSIDEDDYFELMIRNAWKISGGEGWCANSSCRRVLVTHQGGHQTVEEIKNDIGMKDDDFEGMIANLKNQKIHDVTCIELSNGTKYDLAAAKASKPDKATPQVDQTRPATAPAPAAVNNDRAKSANPRREPGGKSTIQLW